MPSYYFSGVGGGAFATGTRGGYHCTCSWSGICYGVEYYVLAQTTHCIFADWPCLYKFYELGPLMFSAVCIIPNKVDHCTAFRDHGICTAPSGGNGPPRYSRYNNHKARLYGNIKPRQLHGTHPRWSATAFCVVQ